MNKLFSVLLFIALIFSSQFLFIKADEDEEVKVESVQENKPQTQQQEQTTPEPAKDLYENYSAPTIDNTNVAFFENFNTDFKGRWISSSSSAYNGFATWSTASKVVGFSGDKGLLFPDPARKYAVSAAFKPAVDNTGKDLVIQYEVKLQDKLECGGAYIKLLADNPELELNQLVDSTPYIIMFGPDKCGSNNKVHFIFRHQNPKTGTWEEKHLKNAPQIKNDQLTHLYTLIIRSDNSYEMLIDQESVRKGSLLTDFLPPVNPPAEINDPTDSKPEDWVDEAKIADTTAVKPDDWDESATAEINDPTDSKPSTWLDNEPTLIPDPTTVKPDGWDDEEDGVWQAPLIPNPKCEEFGCGQWSPKKIPNPAYKGKWTPPLIDNPAYKGEWKPRQIPNPDFFEDQHPHNLPKIGAVAIEVWTMQGQILFDNFLVAYDSQIAKDYASKTWAVKYNEEKLKAPKPEPTAEDDQGSNFSTQLSLILNELMTQLSILIDEYPIPTFSVIGFMFLSVPILFCFACRSSPQKKFTVKKDDEESDEEEEEEEQKDKKKDDEEEEESEEEEEKEKKTTSKTTSSDAASKVTKRKK